MSQQDLFDYVMNTPHNTNPAILKQMLKDITGSGNLEFVDWNAAEGEAGHVLNRTHYEETTIGEVPMNLTFDFNLEGKEYVEVQLEGAPPMKFVKMSDTVLEKNDFIGATLVTLEPSMGDDGGVVEKANTITSENLDNVVMMEESTGVLYLCGPCFVVAPSNVHSNMLDADFTPGIYFMYVYEQGITIGAKSLSVPSATMMGEKTTVKKLDPKFLPDVDLDTTLTQSGKAAEAKATGDAIEQLSEDSTRYGAELDMRTKPGKNLNVTPYEKTYTEYGITFVTHDDNSVTISGKAEGNHNIFWPIIANAVDARWRLPTGTYTLSGAYSPLCSITLFLYESQTATSPKAEYVQGGDNGVPRNVVVENDCWAIIRFNVANQWNDGNITIYPQLEAGNVATAYVSPWTEDKYSQRLADIESSVSELHATVNPLVVPNYYFAGDYLTDKVARINELARSVGADGDAFVFISDTHWEKNAGKSPALLKYLCENTHIDRLFGGGDYQDNALSIVPPLFKCVDALRDTWTGKRYLTLGNHDYMGSEAYALKDKDLYYAVNSYGVERVGNLNRNYYYVDNPQTKLRYIVLNRYIDRVPVNNEINGLNEEQRTWLQNDALDVEEGWGVLVFVHDLYRFIYGEDGYTATMSLNYSDSRATVEILDAFVADGGTVVGIFCGENHVDMVNRTPGGIPVITTTCDKNKSSGEGVPISGQWAERLDGTIHEQAFDVMIVDKANRAIYAVRIGYPARNSVEGSYGDLVEERTINY